VRMNFIPRIVEAFPAGRLRSTARLAQFFR
jgi:hypothetical protein